MQSHDNLTTPYKLLNWIQKDKLNYNNLSLNLAVNNLANVYPDEIVTGGDFVTDLGGRFKYPWEVNQFGFMGTNIQGTVSYNF